MNDEEMVERICQLEQQLRLKDRVIDLLYQDIEDEYSGTNYLKSLEEYYEEAKNYE